jgi:hypothetical protein
MVYYQLFRILPDIKFINKICKLYGINDLEEYNKFTINDLKKMNTVKNIENIRSELSRYYLYCKFKTYVENLDEKKSITILRHFLKVINYKVESAEKYSNHQKYLVYNIKNLNPNRDYQLIVDFD